MREFQAKKRVRKLIYSKWVVALLIVFVLLVARATWGVFKKAKESAANVAEAQQELDRLNDRQKVLISEVTRLSADAGIEEEIRSKFSVSKPGEKMLIIVDPQSSTTPPVVQHESWWDKFKNLFK